MGRFKSMLRIGRIVMIVIGGFCLPWPRGDNPKQDLSVFYLVRSMHAFVKMGMILIAPQAPSSVISVLSASGEA